MQINFQDPYASLNPLNPPTGCHFHTRCPIAKNPLCNTEKPLCNTDKPQLEQNSQGHWVSCHLPG